MDFDWAVFVEDNLGLMNKSNNDLTSHRKGSLVICASIMDFDWAASVDDNQNNTSLLGEDRV